MSAPPLVIGEDASLEDAAHLMLAHASDAVVVVRADGSVSGILSEADFAGCLTIFHPQGAYSTDVIRMPRLLGQWLAENDLERLTSELRKQRVGDVMRSPVATATPHEALQPILERMLRENLQSVPVVRDGRPIGVVSARALLRLMAKGANLNQAED